MNNLKQLGIALQQYDGQYGAFPGHIMLFPGSMSTSQSGNKITMTAPIVSWLVLQLPYLDRMDIYSYYKTAVANPNFNANNFVPPKPLLQIGECPTTFRPTHRAEHGWLIE